jgi:hypothetical protein
MSPQKTTVTAMTSKPSFKKKTYFLIHKKPLEMYFIYWATIKFPAFLRHAVLFPFYFP